MKLPIIDTNSYCRVIVHPDKIILNVLFIYSCCPSLAYFYDGQKRYITELLNAVAFPFKHTPKMARSGASGHEHRCRHDCCRYSEVLVHPGPERRSTFSVMPSVWQAVVLALRPRSPMRRRLEARNGRAYWRQCSLHCSCASLATDYPWGINLEMLA